MRTVVRVDGRRIDVSRIGTENRLRSIWADSLPRVPPVVNASGVGLWLADTDDTAEENVDGLIVDDVQARAWRASA